MGNEILYMAGIVVAGFAVNFGLRALPFAGVQWRTACPYIAAAVTVGLQIWRRNPLLSIVVGTLVYMAAVRIAGAA